ncbi:lysophospholipase [Epithele typhae]|uniref:lysophospholipase n=1 Tax=Epithele typhae TaxID=378194 RepID=UPI0020073544|nr:lysophospholipase [Epithele typhae]KAH9944244.1 lysophospholipase [Epithele typhae]
MSESAPLPYDEQWLDGPFETKFYTRLYLPPSPTPTRAVLVFIHGYIEHIGRYTAAHARWASDGVAVFAYDMRGFGRTALGDQRSPSSLYGKTGGIKERASDAEWAITHAHTTVPDVPVFLMAHSMGAGLALSFATRDGTAPPEQKTVDLLSGVIASSPLVEVARRAPSTLERKLLEFVGRFLPNLVIKTPVQDKVSDSLKDPYIKGYGRLEGLIDMISRGELLLQEGYKQWPARLPVLILHGSADMVNAFPPTKEVFEKLQAPDKEFIIYEGMMHDLMTEPDIKDKYFNDCFSWLENHISTSTVER